MLFKEFGDKNLPTIIFLHGGGLSWWQWRYQIDTFKNEFHVIVFIIDGHGDDYNNTFKTIGESAKNILEYIKTKCNGKVYAICGLSLGAQIAIEVISQESDITEYAVIESALVIPMKLTAKFVVPTFKLCYGLIKKKWFAKLQAKQLLIPDSIFDEYFADTKLMSKETLINFTVSNADYLIPATLKKTKAKTLILCGEKELSVMKKSARLLNKEVLGSTLIILKNRRHGEISIVYPKEYVELVKDFFSNKSI